MYNSYNKSPALGVFFEILLPTSGYAYSSNWGRGFIVKGCQGGLFVGAILLNLNSESTSDENRNLNTALIGSVVIQLYSYFDVAKQTRNYNRNLYREIFGKEPPSFSLNLQPTYQGAHLTLAPTVTYPSSSIWSAFAITCACIR